MNTAIERIQMNTLLPGGFPVLSNHFIVRLPTPVQHLLPIGIGLVYPALIIRDVVRVKRLPIALTVRQLSGTPHSLRSLTLGPLAMG